MEVDEIQRQVSKFQRVCSNGSSTTTGNSSNPQRIVRNRNNLELENHHHVDDGGGGGGGVARLCGWPSSRIVRVSRASGGKDRHSKVLTSKGLRDRRVRLSVSTAIQFYDLQDRLGYDQPSKAVEWLLKAAASSIDELPSLDPPFPGGFSEYHLSSQRKLLQNGENNGENGENIVSHAKSPACSSTSETSKGSGLSLSRSEIRIKARERAREMTSKREKGKEIDSARVTVLNHLNNPVPENNSSFTDLLTGGSNINNTSRSPMDYFYNHHQPHHNFSSFLQLQDSFMPPVTTTTTGGGCVAGGGGGGVGGGGETYNLNFAMTSSTTGVASGGCYSRGTLQSNLPSSLLPHHHQFQRFQSDGSTSTNLPFFIVPNSTVDHYSTTGGYHLNYGGGGGGDGGDRRSDHQKDKSKN